MVPLRLMPFIWSTWFDVVLRPPHCVPETFCTVRRHLQTRRADSPPLIYWCPRETIRTRARAPRAGRTTRTSEDRDERRPERCACIRGAHSSPVHARAFSFGRARDGPLSWRCHRKRNPATDAAGATRCGDYACDHVRHFHRDGATGKAYLSTLLSSRRLISAG